MVIGLLGLSLLVAAVHQLIATLKSSYVPASDTNIGMSGSNDDKIASSDVARITLWSLVAAAALLVLVQILTP